MARYRGRGGAEEITAITGRIFSIVMIITGMGLGMFWLFGPYYTTKLKLGEITDKLQEISANKSPDQLASSLEIKELEKQRKEEEQKEKGNNVLIGVSIALTLLGLGGMVLLIFFI